MNTPARILIVEDERLIALDLSKRLPKFGYEVCGIIASGEEAIARAKDLNPDLVLMDICLQGEMDGVQAAEVIRRSTGLPVIFLTANSDQATLDRAKLTHPSSYILKPFKERELQIGIEMALMNHRLNAQLRAAHDTLERRVAARTGELALANESLKNEIVVRKQKEAQAREQADLLAQARDAIYVRDIGGRISYWNRSAERLYEVPAGDAIGASAALLLGEQPGSTAEEAEAAALTKGEWTGEIRHVSGNGQELFVESRWTLVRDEAGRPSKILVVNTDITERKRVDEQFLRAQRLESIGALASGIAHDLNNVFAPIMLATDLMGQADATEFAPLVNIVKGSAQRGADMVKQVLMFVRGSSEEKDPIFVNRVASEVSRLMRETLPCSIRVKADVPKQLAAVVADPTQIHQVLMNLCVNARDAMPEGGELLIRVAEVSVGADKAALHPGARPGQHVCLTVGDTGTGIPPEVREKIFDPFFTTKELGKGTGLGLATVTSIVASHDGFLELDSDVGKGTRFHIYLPACDAKEDAPEVPAEKLPVGHGELVLVVDDEQSVREITKLTLEAHGYHVVLANDGAEALSLFFKNRENLRLVLTDIMMPILNGRAFIHALRKIEPTIPVLAFSAGERSNSLLGNLEEEGVALVRKPASPMQLLSGVATALRSSVPAGHYEAQFSI